MPKSLKIFLQAIIIILGIGALAFLIWEPTAEGRNVDASLFEIYFKDPFLAYAYIGSIAFFVALYKAFIALKYVSENKTYSEDTLKALKAIKYSTLILIAFVLGGQAYIFITMRGKDDIAGGIAMGMFVIIISAAICITAAMLQKNVQNKLNT